MERRKVTFKLYPNAREAERLTSWIRLHCELYNAALEERIDAYRKAGKSKRRESSLSMRSSSGPDNLRR
ncbi:hypothetical protein [Caballeronia mineralivorans]|uniref:hypothetical protein n=1 Tax=Caballeronia mineralivorans TaxID=2010198 RepID=UPI0023F555EA|nr:hypothetical protein [Caballeronia mineralivorans]MDB5788923.1 istA [Caballeronia mineralivorans]